MCTLVVLRRPGHPWPLLMAANRDEMRDRAWRPPSRHWPGRPNTVAGQDQLGGGSWLGINDFGVVAGILNRTGSLGPQQGKRSRGELVLAALDHRDASAAATILTRIAPDDYRSFNMVVADRRTAYWVRHRGQERAAAERTPAIEAFELPPGLSMLTSCDRNDPASARIRTYLPRFEAATPPDPRKGTWGNWKRLLAGRRFDDADGPQGAMTVIADNGFETVSSSLIALPGPPQSARGKPAQPVWLFAAGRPDCTPFEEVTLQGPPK